MTSDIDVQEELLSEIIQRLATVITNDLDCHPGSIEKVFFYSQIICEGAIAQISIECI